MLERASILERLSSGALLIATGHLSLELSNNFLPVAYPLLIQKLDLSYAQVGTVAFVAVTAATLLQPLFGYLSDRFDSRKLLVLSLFWIGTIMALTGLAGSYWLLLFVVAAGGLGSAAFHPAAAALASAVAGRRRGASMSIFSVGGNMGAALSPLLIGTALLQLGLPGTVVLVPVMWAISFVLFRRFARLPAVNGRAADSSSPSSGVQIGPPLALVLVVLIAAARSWFQASLNTYLPEWLQTQGWSAEHASLLLSVMLASVAVGSLTGGTLSDRLGRLPVVLLSFTLAIPVLWFLLHTHGPLQVLCISLAGVMIGATFPVTILMAQEAWPRAVGLASSLAIGLGWLPGGLGAWSVGILADRFSLTFALSTLIAAPLVGLGAAILFMQRFRH
ncbi:MAG TPA: MFS transporter [Candidatus Binatia bacterium]|nr:MFS transporter [Candidatus Binatia bacterium]